MTAFVDLQEREFAAVQQGFSAVRHQREVGAGYFDAVTQAVTSETSLAAMVGSTEEEQFQCSALTASRN